MTNPLTADELEEMRHFCPDDEALASAQKDDPEWNSKREQLQILHDEPKHLLNETYMKKLGISDARLKSLSHLQMVGDVLCHVPLPRQFYQADGTAKLAIESTAPLKIVPAKLRDMIAYLHHYSALAVHAYQRRRCGTTFATRVTGFLVAPSCVRRCASHVTSVSMRIKLDQLYMEYTRRDDFVRRMNVCRGIVLSMVKVDQLIEVTTTV